MISYIFLNFHPECLGKIRFLFCVTHIYCSATKPPTKKRRTNFDLPSKKKLPAPPTNPFLTWSYKFWWVHLLLLLLAIFVTTDCVFSLVAGRTPSFPTCASNVAGRINTNSPTARVRPRAVRVRRGFHGTWMVDLPCVSWHWPLKLGRHWLREGSHGAKEAKVSQLCTWLSKKKTDTRSFFLGDSGWYFWTWRTIYGIKTRFLGGGQSPKRIIGEEWIFGFNSQGFVGNFRTEIFAHGVSDCWGMIHHDVPQAIKWVAQQASMIDHDFFGEKGSGKWFLGSLPGIRIKIL